jgi:hypothetical protein
MTYIDTPSGRAVVTLETLLDIARSERAFLIRQAKCEGAWEKWQAPCPFGDSFMFDYHPKTQSVRTNHLDICPIRNGPVGRWHFHCGGCFVKRGKWLDLECDLCGERLAGTSKSATASADREEKSYQGNLYSFIDVEFRRKHKEVLRARKFEVSLREVFDELQGEESLRLFNFIVSSVGMTRDVVGLKCYLADNIDSFRDYDVVRKNSVQKAESIAVCQISNGSLNPKALPFVPKTNMKAAERAVIRSRGKRAGRRVRQNLPGRCWEKLLPRKLRTKENDLGFYPTIGAVNEMLRRLDVVPKNKRIEFLYKDGVHGAHVVEEPKWPYLVQANINNQLDANRPLGASLETWDKEPCYASHFEAGELPPEMIEIAEFVSQYVPKDDKPELEIGGDTDKKTKLADIFEGEDDEIIVPPKFEDIDFTHVGGDSDCWKELFTINPKAKEKYPFLLQKNDPLTLEQFSHLRWMVFNDIGPVAGAHVAIKMTLQNQMLHLADVGFFPDGPLPKHWAFICQTNNCCASELDRKARSKHRELSLAFRAENYRKVIEIFEIGGCFDSCCAKHLKVGKQTPSPLEQAMATVASPEVRVGVERGLQVPLSNMIEQAKKICPYRIPVSIQHYMEQLGLPWLPAGEVHIHPMHAGIRRNILFNELPKHIKCDTTFISMTPAHHELLVDAVRALNPGCDWKLPLVNPVLDIRDISRFAGTGTVPDKVFELPPITTPGVHIDESWHYLNPEFMDGLARKNPNVVHVTAISIFPLLSLTLEQSPDPDLYGYAIHKEKGKPPMLVYWMEGRINEKYIQPFDPTMIVAKRIESTDGKIVWTGGSVYKMLNTRLHVFTRYNLTSPQFDIEIENKYIKLPKVFRNQMELPMMRLDHFQKIADYAKVMPQDKSENYWGKWRLMLQDEGIHLPWGYKEHMIDVIVECKRLSRTPKLMSRDITGFWHNCYYQTFGKVLKLYEKKLVMPYVHRRAEMISQDSHIVIYPGLNIVVKPWKTSDSLYSIAWNVDEDDGRGFWDKFKMFLKAWGHKGEVPSDIRRDLGGHIRFPFSANTWLQQQRLGIAEIKESQQVSFRQVFEAGCEPNKPKFKSEVRVHTNKMFPGIEQRSLVHTTEKMQLVKPPIDADDATVVSYTTDGSVYEEPEELPQMPPQIPEKNSIAYRHCDNCKSYMVYMEEGGKPGLINYHAFCAAQHSAGPEAVRRVNIALAMAATRRRQEARDHLPVIQEESVIEVPMLPEAPPAPEAKPEATTSSIAPDSRPDRNRVRASVDPQTTVPYVAKNPVEFTKKKRLTHAECEVEWLKMKALLSREKTTTLDVSGSLLWDALYPQTVDARFTNIPYRDVAMYPGPKYPDNDCLLVALGDISGFTPASVLFKMQRGYKRSALQHQDTLEEALIWPFACHIGVGIKVRDGRHERYYGVKTSRLEGVITLKDGHYEACEPLRVPLRIKEYKAPKSFTNNPVLKNVRNWVAVDEGAWVPEKTRADRLVRALLAGEIGLINQPINREALLAWSSTVDIGYKGPPKSMAVVMGDPGCRKSTEPQRHMKASRVYQQWTMIAPTNQIAQDYRDKLDATTPDARGRKMHGDMVVTWESALARYAGAELIVCDENKYPPGYIALFHILNPTAKTQLFLGDAWQASWHWPKPTALNDEVSELEFYAPRSKGFIVGTWRFAGLSACFWRMPSYSNRKGAWAFTRAIPNIWTGLQQYFPWENDATLLDMWERRQEYTAAHFQAEFAEEMRGSEARSYSGSIGVTTPLAIIHVDDAVMRGSDPRLIYTAMTRSWNILFVINWVHNRTSEYLEAIHPVFSKLAHYRRAYRLGQRLDFSPENSVSIREITKPFPPEWKIWMAGPFEKCTNFDLVKQWWPKESWDVFLDPDAKRGGARLARDEEVYVNEPTFQPFIQPEPEFEPEDPPPEDVQPPDIVIPTSVPLESRADFEEFHTAQVRERFDADKFVKGQLTNQFNDEPRVRFDAAEQLAKIITESKGRSRRERAANALATLKSIEKTDKDPRYTLSPIALWAAYQRADDHASWLMAKAQRIRYSTPEANLKNYMDQMKFGDMCWESFKHYMNWKEPVPWNELRYHQAIEKFQFRRGDRSGALKKGSLNRADPNFNITITLKQQLKLKDEEWKPAKPPQPVWIHPDYQLFTEGPYGVLLLDLLLEHKPPWWHFHARETYESFASWAEAYMKPYDQFEMNDLVGQDQSTQGWAVRVLENLMRWFNFPEHAINEFKHNKMFKTLDGKVFIAIMTDSGEVWTFMINTISSTARECFMFNLQPGHPQANGGDDTWRAVAGTINPEYEPFRSMDPCEDKRYVSDRGDFTSHCYKNGVLFKNPIILLKRFMSRLATGKGEDAVLGYGEAWRRNYDLREKLIGVMSEQELAAHNVMTRIFMNLKHEGLKTRLSWDKHYDTEIDQIPDEAAKSFQILRSIQQFAPVFTVAQSIASIAPVESSNVAALAAYTAEF